MKARFHEQQLELGKSLAVVETKQMILTELQGRFEDKKKALPVASALKAGDMPRVPLHVATL